jgi:hypothetical protein
MKYKNKLILIISFLLLFGCIASKPPHSKSSNDLALGDRIKKDYKEATISSVILKHKEEINSHAGTSFICPVAGWDNNGYFTKVLFLDSIRNMPEIKYLCLQTLCQNLDEIHLLRNSFKHEIKIQEENDKYWIPCFDESKISKLLKMPQNDTINIYYKFIGSINDETNHVEPVFIIDYINI